MPREALARLVGEGCNLDDLLADIVEELRGRPYEIVFVAGGWQYRTRPRFANAIRAAGSGALRDVGASELTPTEILAVRAIAYLQPATRAPNCRASPAYVTTRKFLEVFGLASPRDLPDLEWLEDEGLIQRPSFEGDIDRVLGIREENSVELTEVTDIESSSLPRDR